MGRPSSFKENIPSFSKKLSGIDMGALNLAAYPKTYLQLLLNNQQYYLRIYAHVLDKLFENINKPKEEMVLIDYGAGNGLLGMFAKHCGVATVYLNDQSALFVEASMQLAKVLEINIDGFITGDCIELEKYFEHKTKPDAIAGTDVIEHIYNLDEFFIRIAKLNPEMVTVFTTASVTSNPFKTKQLMRLQYNDEFYGSNPDHAMPGDVYAGLPFIETRKKIILEQYPAMKKEALESLAFSTRGMNKHDLLIAAGKFIQEGFLPSPPHPTNTCDPVTGSWTERLLTIKEYDQMYKRAGFELKVYNGFYNQWQAGAKSIVLNLLNKIIFLGGKRGDFIAPFITLVGKKK